MFVLNQIDPVVVTGGKFNIIPRRCYGIKFQHDQLTIPEKRFLFERRCSLLQVRLNLTNIFSLPSFLYNPSRASCIYCRLTKGFCPLVPMFCCCAALNFKSSTSNFWNGSKRRRPSDHSGIYEQKMLVDIYHIQDQVI